MFLLLFLMMFLSPIFALEDGSIANTLENTTDSVCTMDVKECWDGSFVSRNPSRNCEFYACPIQNDLDADVCAKQIKELNIKIEHEFSPLLIRIEKLYAEFREQERIYLMALKEYEMCLNQTKQDNENSVRNLSTTSKMTANIILSNSRITNLESANKLSDIDKEILNAEKITTTDQMIENIVINDISILETKDFSSNSDKCLREKEKYEIEQQKLKKLKEEINQLKLQHKEIIETMSHLKKERDILIESCTQKNTIEICNIPQDLILQEKELIKEINNLTQLSLNSLQKDEHLDKLKILRNEYRLIQEKINVIKESCNRQKNQSAEIEKPCAEKDEIKKILEELYNLVNNTLDEKEIYLLKEKIVYYEEKLNNFSCDGIKTEDQKTEYLEKKIKELESERERLKSEINNLKSTITQLKEKFSVAKKEDKYKLIFENSKDISQHTAAIVEKEIINLKKVLENINASNMSEETKEKIREKLQLKIANLEQTRSTLSFVLTAEELENVVNDAKELTLNSKKLATISVLEKNILTLSSIIDKYLLESKNYLLLKNEVDQLLKEVSNISIDSLNQEDIIVFNNRYQELKEKVRAEIN
ncbi:MAG: hypothetical protein PHU47_00320 [Candidatus ainarchaeum sp.]|nr:hypothetical protein [Candidatus ainarchaeum sp.]